MCDYVERLNNKKKNKNQKPAEDGEQWQALFLRRELSPLLSLIFFKFV